MSENITPNELLFSMPQTLMSAKPSYCPFVLSFNGINNQNRRWTLTFQQHPENAILLEGDDPTQDEILQCLMSTNAPVWVVGICQVAAAVAKRKAPSHE